MDEPNRSRHEGSQLEGINRYANKKVKRYEQALRNIDYRYVQTQRSIMYGVFNDYGNDFKHAGNAGKKQVCLLGFDGDGHAMGHELGDPCCA